MVSWKGPCTPSAQICSWEMSWRLCAVGGECLVGSPVAEDHLLEKELKGMCATVEPAVTLKSALNDSNCAMSVSAANAALKPV